MVTIFSSYSSNNSDSYSVFHESVQSDVIIIIPVIVNECIDYDDAVAEDDYL